MKVVHVLESTATGTLTAVTTMANRQNATGNQVLVIYSVRSETPADLASRFDSGIELCELPMHPGLNALTAIGRLRKRIRGFRPKFVFLHSSIAGAVGRVALVGIAASVYYFPHCIALMKADLNFVQRGLVRFVEIAASLKQFRFVAVSASEQKTIQSAVPFRECLLIENAVDSTYWKPKFPTGRVQQVITVGQVRPQKGPEQFAAIAQRLPHLEFVWAGDANTDRERNALLDAGVIVTGWLSTSEIRTALHKSPYYLSTAGWEGLPIAVIEAMQAGCCPVLSACAGNVDLIEDGVNGFLFETTDQAVKILESLEADKARRIRIAKQAISASSSRFGFERYFAQLDKLVSETVSADRNRA